MVGMNNIPEDLEGFEGGVLYATDLFGSRKEDYGQAWDANDASK